MGIAMRSASAAAIAKMAISATQRAEFDFERCAVNE
jgi:hypothetical protein